MEPGDHLVEDDAQAIDVAARVGRCAGKELRREIGDGADRGAGRAHAGAVVVAGEPEVDQDHAAVPRQHHVASADVAVEETFLMRVVESICNRGADPDRLGLWKRPGGDHVAKRDAVDELDREVEPALILAGVVEGGDSCVAQRTRVASLAQESAASLVRVGHALGQELERDGAREQRVFGLPDRAHTPFAQLLDDLVATDHAAQHEASLRAGARKARLHGCEGRRRCAGGRTRESAVTLGPTRLN